MHQLVFHALGHSHPRRVKTKNGQNQSPFRSAKVYRGNVFKPHQNDIPFQSEVSRGRHLPSNYTEDLVFVFIFSQNILLLKTFRDTFRPFLFPRSFVGLIYEKNNIHE